MSRDLAPSCWVKERRSVPSSHLPADRFLRSTAVPYLRGYTSELWDAALEALDKEVRDWFQLRLGHAVTGYPPLDDRALLLIGSGDNGKSTLIDGMDTSLGNYSSAVQPVHHQQLHAEDRGDGPWHLAAAAVCAFPVHVHR
jgi:phage/plasmid-associated DNA primase